MNTLPASLESLAAHIQHITQALNEAPENWSGRGRSYNEWNIRILLNGAFREAQWMIGSALGALVGEVKGISPPRGESGYSQQLLDEACAILGEDGRPLLSPRLGKALLAYNDIALSTRAGLEDLRKTAPKMLNTLSDFVEEMVLRVEPALTLRNRPSAGA